MTGKSTVTGGGRAKGGSSTACFHPFFSYPYPIPPSPTPYTLQLHKWFLHKTTNTHKRVDSKNNRKFIDLTPSIFSSTESKKSKEPLNLWLLLLLLFLCFCSCVMYCHFFLLLLIKQNISIEYLFCSCCCCECVKQKKSYTFDLIKKYTIFGSLLVSRYSQRWR